MQYGILIGQLILLGLTLLLFLTGYLFASNLGKAIHRRIVRHAIRAYRSEKVCLSCVEQCREFGSVIDQGHVSFDLPPTLDPGGRTGEMAGAGSRAIDNSQR